MKAVGLRTSPGPSWSAHDTAHGHDLLDTVHLPRARAFWVLVDEPVASAGLFAVHDSAEVDVHPGQAQLFCLGRWIGEFVSVQVLQPGECRARRRTDEELGLHGPHQL